MNPWRERIERAVKEELIKQGSEDGSHGYAHVCRVSALAVQFAKEEKGDELVAFAAGMLHDIISLPKNDPEAKKSSFYAAARSKELLLNIQFPSELITSVCHAVHAHSFSAQVEPKTIEAQCVQDADRMEALGAIGLMRVFYSAGLFGSQLMDESDPVGERRALNDKKFALDHFAQKLLTLQGTMKTVSGKGKAALLSRFLEEYRSGLLEDHRRGNHQSGRFKIARACCDSGQTKGALFHPGDPFAKKGRALATQNYALDHLLNEKDPYVEKFLNQLRFELSGLQGRQDALVSGREGELV